MSRYSLRALCVALVAALTVLVAAPAGAAPRRDRTPPTTPGNLRVTAVTATTLSLAWEAATDNAGLNAYIVYQQSALGTYGIYHPPGSTAFTDTIGVRGYTKTYWVVAEDTSGNRSGESDRVTASTTPDTSPPTTPALSVTGVTQSTVSLSWTTSTDDAGAPGYRIFVNGAPTQFTGIGTRTVRHLTPGTAYTFTVRAVDAAGNLSPPSNAVPVTTAPSDDATAPTAPGNLRVTSDLGCAVDLAWNASTDDATPIEYEVSVNGGIQTILVGVTRAFVYHAGSGLNTFAVRAVDPSGNSSPRSNVVTSVFAEC